MMILNPLSLRPQATPCHRKILNVLAALKELKKIRMMSILHAKPALAFFTSNARITPKEVPTGNVTNAPLAASPTPTVMTWTI
jgi:hypothetical protein